MIEMGVEEARGALPRLLGSTVVIVDDRGEICKKAVLLPYEEYRLLLERAEGSGSSQEESVKSIRAFRGSLRSDMKVEESRYCRIVEVGK